MFRLAAAGELEAPLALLDVGEGEPDEVREEMGLSEAEEEGSDEVPSAVKLPHCASDIDSQFRFHSALSKPSPAAMLHCLNHSRHCRPGTVCSYLAMSGSVPFLHLQVNSSVSYKVRVSAFV